MVRHADDQNRFQFDDVTESTFGAQVGPMLLKVHPESKCEGRPCVVHNPLPGHMMSWPINFRSDLGISERICPHGVGHPCEEDVLWKKSMGQDWVVVHSCDGCCVPPEGA